MLHSFFFSSLARSMYVSFSLSFNFTPWSTGTAKSTILNFLCRLLKGLVVWPRSDDPFVSHNPREFCASHFPREMLGCANTICSSNLNLLHNSQWIILPTQSCRVLYSFCANLLRYLMSTPPNGHVWHKAFLVGPSAGPEPTHTRHFQKCLWPRRHSPY